MIVAAAIDYRALARKRIPRFLFEYVDGGSCAETTLRSNLSDLEEVLFRQRVLRDTSALELSTTLLGQHMRMPVALGPIGLAGMYATRGETQAACAAEQGGVPFTLSTVSVCSLGEVTASVRQPIWFQLYMMRDRGFMRELLARAEARQCSALMFTVDMPVPGSRYRDYRSGLAGAPGIRGRITRGLQALRCPGWAWSVGVRGRPHHLGNVAPLLGDRTGLEDFFAWMRTNFDSSVTWRDVAYVREHWHRPLILKGILEVEDARQAAAIGADAIVVSNHGGRQLDGAVSTARALPAISQAVAERVTVLADGGVRSGLDVLRMLALGAHGVLLGRAWVYALAARGGEGVKHLLQLIESELRVAMSLTGVRTIRDISAEILHEYVTPVNTRAVNRTAALPGEMQ